MPPHSADAVTVQLIRRLAEATHFTFVSPQARSDMMAYNLTRADVGDAIVDWIESEERVKQTTIHSIAHRIGDPAYEMKPKIAAMTWYIKVSIDDRGGPNEGLALLSSHADH